LRKLGLKRGRSAVKGEVFREKKKRDFYFDASTLTHI